MLKVASLAIIADVSAQTNYERYQQGASGYINNGKEDTFWHIWPYGGSYNTPVSQYNPVYTPIQHKFNPKYTGYTGSFGGSDHFYYINPTYQASYAPAVTHKPINGPSGYWEPRNGNSQGFWHIDETPEGQYLGSYTIGPTEYNTAKVEL